MQPWSVYNELQMVSTSKLPWFH
uniref:Uncharacterized protein n=1 Tax=Timema bartmani TaxID=61472 RepID=A0A7R9I4V0_9NEOP|nr:unnamed protein product [Timema bartmani]